MRFTEYVGTKLKKTGPLINILRVIYYIGIHPNTILKITTGIVLRLPEFCKVHNNISRGMTLEKGRPVVVDVLKKVDLWHSNWLGLIDFFELDPEFNKLFERASKTYGIHKMRCFMLYQCLKQTGILEGDVAEVGVYKGRSAKVIALTVEKQNKHSHLFDTFTGMPEVDTEKDNFYQKGDISDTSLSEVREFLADCQNVTIYPGFFPDTAQPIVNRKFSFVHIDVDIYRSVLDCCQFFYPRMVSRGMMVFDDPGFADCAGAKLAVDEFFADKEEFPIYLATAQVLVIKH